MARRFARRGGVVGAAALLRVLRLVLGALAVSFLVTAFIVPSRASVLPGTRLTSGTDFVVTGDAVQATPGLPDSLNVSVTNPLPEPITLTSVTVTVSPTPTVPVVPPNCPGTDLSLQYQSLIVPFSGGPSEAVLTLPSPQLVVASGTSAQVAALDVVLARGAGNECQHVVFPLNYAATATSSVTTTPSTTPTTVVTSPGTTLPFTGAQIIELTIAGFALVAAGALSIVLARRRRREAAR